MKFIENKVILITGGTGSFGNAILKDLIKLKVKEIRIFSRDEKKQEDMRIDYNNNKIKFIIGDVRDYQSISSATKDVDYIFHAAALKQVPSCEFFPLEAVNTNIIGTSNLINAGIVSRVKKIVVLSTDKAVYPINAMGISKAMAEKIAISKSRTLSDKNDTVICCTRYGNVMGSRGSVIPLFIDQIKKNKDVTVTDLNMTRFLMSLDNSVDLVLHAFKKSNQGDIFVQKSPSARLSNLVIALQQIFNSSSNIKTIGTRHGEKLYETLISREEMTRCSETKNYYTISTDQRDLNYSQYFHKGEINISIQNDYTSHNAKLLNVSDIKKLLLKLDFVQRALNA
jgi:UDP-glucose 4-epimerase